MSGSKMSLPDIPATSGIYTLVFKNGSRYVGGSKNMRSRVYTHLSWLRNGGGQTEKLRAAFVKFGMPEARVLLFCATGDLRKCEKVAYAALKPTLCKPPCGGTVGVKLSRKACRNMAHAAARRDNSRQSKRQLESWVDPVVRARRLTGMKRWRTTLTNEKLLKMGRKATTNRVRNLRNG